MALASTWKLAKTDESLYDLSLTLAHCCCHSDPEG